MVKKKRGGARSKSRKSKSNSPDSDIQDNEFFHSHLTKLHKYIQKGKSSGKAYSEIKKDLKRAGWVEHLIDLTENSLHQPSEKTVELKQYIIDCLMTGVTKNQIEKILLNAGWRKQLVIRLFSEIKKLNDEMIRKEKELRKRRDPEELKKRRKNKIGIDLRDIMIHPVISIDPESSITHAARLMSKYKIGCVMVIDARDRPIGILSETDILRDVVAKGLDSNEVGVEDIMTKDIIYATPDMKIIEISTMMKEYNIKKMPVIQNGKVIGIVTTTQIVQLMAM